LLLSYVPLVPVLFRSLAFFRPGHGSPRRLVPGLGLRESSPWRYGASNFPGVIVPPSAGRTEAVASPHKAHLTEGAQDR